VAAYHRPLDLRTALDVLATESVRIAAGCTDLFPATRAAALPGPILDITAIPDLRGVSRVRDGWRIGAATTWADILHADLPAAFDGLKLAAAEVGAIQIQNAGTVAGNLCTASPAADGVPCLMVLDAMVELRTASGARALTLADFLTGARTTALRDDEMVTAILIPEHAGRGRGTFLKLGARKYLIISIAMVAARLDVVGGVIAEAAISVGACSAVAVRLAALEQRLTGSPVGAAADLISADLVGPALSPIDDIRADAAYRKAAATELVRRAVATLAATPQDHAA